MSTSKPYTKGSLYQIPCDSLQTDPNQPRKYFDPAAQEDLVDSIKTHGLLTPILFREDQERNLFVVAGERRLQAAIKAGLDTIPGILVEGKHEEIALVENILREDLTAIELAEALDRIQNEYNYTQEEMIGIIGKAKSTVNDILTLNKLPKEIKDECRNDPSVSRQVLIEIVRKKKRDKGMVTAFKKYKDRISSPKKTRGPKGKRTFQTRFTSKFDRIKTFMTGIDLGKLDTANRKNLSLLVEELKKAADGLLKKIKSAPDYVKETKPVAKPKPKKETPKKKPAKTVRKQKTKKK